MKGQFAMIMSLAGASLILATMALHARGEVPPMPPYSGGSAGDWLGSGPIFGFDTLGGPGGGWGGGWFGGGWTGWGSGFGGGLLGGGGSGSSSGHLFDTTKKDGHDGLQNTCWKETLPGGYYCCVCSVFINPFDPPCLDCPVYGTCTRTNDRTEMPCTYEYELCTSMWP